MRVPKYLVTLVMAQLMTSCGVPGSPLQTQTRLEPFFDAAGFNSPISLEVDLNTRSVLDYRGDVRNSSNTVNIAFLVANGAIDVGPNTGGPPYWNFVDRSGAVVEGTRNFSLGTRRVTARSDARSWSEGSIEYFAETLAYVIDVDSAMSSVSPRELGPYSVRMVIANDPRRGEWALQDVQYSQADGGGAAELREVQAIVTEVGNSARGAFIAKLAAASTASFDSIEQQLAADGLVERHAGNSDVLVSRANNIALHISELDGAMNIVEINQRCAGLQVDGFQSWRIADYSHLERFTRNGRLLADTPDARFWGRLRNRRFITPYVQGIGANEAQRFNELAESTYGPFIVSGNVNNNGELFGQSRQWGFGPYRNFTVSELLFFRIDIRNAILVCAGRSVATE